MTTIPLGPSPAVRAAAVRRGRRLNRVTIGWNAVEGIVAVVAGLAAGSVSLVGFGLDSGIEVSAALSWPGGWPRSAARAAPRRPTDGPPAPSPCRSSPSLLTSGWRAPVT